MIYLKEMLVWYNSCKSKERHLAYVNRHVDVISLGELSDFPSSNPEFRFSPVQLKIMTYERTHQVYNKHSSYYSRNLRTYSVH